MSDDRLHWTDDRRRGPKVHPDPTTRPPEHFCPYCRRQLMAEHHARDCRMGQTINGQAARVGLALIPLQEAIYAESRRSWWGRAFYRITTWLYGPFR